MWVNIKNPIQFNERTAIATLTREDFINQGIPLINLAATLSLRDFNENLVKEMLEKKYKDTSTWQLHVVSYDIIKNTLDILVSSPNFDEVEPGTRSPYLVESNT